VPLTHVWLDPTDHCERGWLDQLKSQPLVPLPCLCSLSSPSLSLSMTKAHRRWQRFGRRWAVGLGFQRFLLDWHGGQKGGLKMATGSSASCLTGSRGQGQPLKGGQPLCPFCKTPTIVEHVSRTLKHPDKPFYTCKRWDWVSSSCCSISFGCQHPDLGFMCSYACHRATAGATSSCGSLKALPLTLVPRLQQWWPNCMLWRTLSR
jgi:hypothetical protein